MNERQEFVVALLNKSHDEHWLDYGDDLEGVALVLDLRHGGTLSDALSDVLCAAASTGVDDIGWHIGAGGAYDGGARVRLYVDFDAEWDLPRVCVCGEVIPDDRWEHNYCDDCRRAAAEARCEGER